MESLIGAYPHELLQTPNWIYELFLNFKLKWKKKSQGLEGCHENLHKKISCPQSEMILNYLYELLQLKV
jgi:hypothetical protein